MREILFRAKVKSKEELIGKGFPIDENEHLKSEWVFGVPIPRYPDLFLARNESCNEYEEVTVIPETVGQYTGVIDKNGVKVFEGDIVRIFDGEYCSVVIKYSNEQGSFTVDDTSLHYWVSDIEVIGNVHDNPELLKGSAENE